MAGSLPAGSDICSAGYRRLAKQLGLAVNTIRRRVQELIDWEFIERLKGENGQRDRYRLLHPVFAERVKAHQKKAEAAAKPKERKAWRSNSPVTPTVRKAANGATVTRDEIAKILGA